MVRAAPFCAAFFSKGFAKEYKVPCFGLALLSSSAPWTICTMDLSPSARWNGTTSQMAGLRAHRLPLP
eukprot:62044-Lingulodinium_polyedra.AAC.1